MEDRRVARVFVSSTFQDMGRERDILARSIFPRLRSRFAAHGIALFEVDLRWGITQELAQTRGTVTLCLEEIDACRPLFFCMLGQRYGWCPPQEGSTQAAHWSVTELEIRRALAKSEICAVRPMFFLRAEALSRRISSSADNEGAMAALKHFVRVEPHAVIHEYSDFDQFEVEAERALAAAIGSWSTAVASSITPSWGGVPRPEASLAIERAVATQRAAIITGENGSGTSWLGEQWARAGSKDGCLGLVLDGRQVNGLCGLADALHAARARHGLVRDTIPAELVGLDEELLALAADAQRHGREIRLFIDHLDDTHAAQSQIDLSMVPRTLPRLCKVLIATRVPRCVTSARELGFGVVDVGAMTLPMTRSFAHAYLEQFGKHLSAEQSAALAGSRLGGNVSSLVLCLEELRRVPRLELLDGHLRQLAALPDEDSVIATMLDGLRASVPDALHGVVDQVLLALSLSVRGLEETELCATASICCGQELPPHAWATIRCGLGRLLVCRGARIDLASGAMRRAADVLRSKDAGLARRVGTALLEHLKQAQRVRWTEEAPTTIWLLDGQRGLREHLQSPTMFLELQQCFPGYALGMFELLGEAREPLLEAWQRELAARGASSEQLWQLGLVAARSSALPAARAFWALARTAGEPSDLHTALEALMLRDSAASERLAHWQPPARISWMSLRRNIDRAEAGERWMRAATVLALAAEGLIDLDEQREARWIGETQYCIGQLSEDAIAAHGWTLIGQLRLGRARWKQALAAFELAVKAARRVGHARRLCVALERSALACIELHRFTKARELGTEALALSRECGMFEQESLAFECLIEVERRRANWQAAFQLCEQYIRRAQAAGRNLDRAQQCLSSVDS